MPVTTKKAERSVLTKEQLQAILESHKNLQDVIDLANSMRKSGKGKDVNYFQQFFMKAQKFV